MTNALKNKPLTSLIIPFYNSRLDYFQEAIESVLAQTYKEWEVIVVNDGSSLANKDLLVNYVSNLNDKRFLVIHLNKNYGPSTARNTGIKNSKGEIIVLLDSDDILLPWYCDEIINKFQEDQKLDVIISDCIFFYDYLKIIKKIYIPKSFDKLLSNIHNPEEVLEKIKTRDQLMVPTFSFKKHVFNEIAYDPEIFFDEDLDLFFQIVDMKKYKVGTLFKPSYLYRSNLSKNRLSCQSKRVFKDIEKIKEKYNNTSSKSIRDYINHTSENNNTWKFSGLIQDFQNNGSLLGFFKKTFSIFSKGNERISCLKTLLHKVILHELVANRLGLSINHSKVLLRKGDNKKLIEVFKKYLNLNTDLQSKYYARKIFQKIF